MNSIKMSQFKYMQEVRINLKTVTIWKSLNIFTNSVDIEHSERMQKLHSN